jgi:hypothetical protein
MARVKQMTIQKEMRLILDYDKIGDSIEMVIELEPGDDPEEINDEFKEQLTKLLTTNITDSLESLTDIISGRKRKGKK